MSIGGWPRHRWPGPWRPRHEPGKRRFPRTRPLDVRHHRRPARGRAARARAGARPPRPARTVCSSAKMRSIRRRTSRSSSSRSEAAWAAPASSSGRDRSRPPRTALRAMPRMTTFACHRPARQHRPVPRVQPGTGGVNFTTCRASRAWAHTRFVKRGPPTRRSATATSTTRSSRRTRTASIRRAPS